MNEINTSKQRESNNSGVFYDESNEGSYENYRNKNLPEGYTDYEERNHDVVYDRYDPLYEAFEKPVQEEKTWSCLRKNFCYKGGQLSI